MANKTLAQAVEAVQGSEALSENYPDGGTQAEKAQAANYFMTGNINGSNYVGNAGKIYTESYVRRFIREGHAISLGMQSPGDGVKHGITLVKFVWHDNQGGTSPGIYEYFFYNSSDNFKTYNSIYGIHLAGDSILIDNHNYIWKNTTVYNTTYANNMISS